MRKARVAQLENRCRTSVPVAGGPGRWRRLSRDRCRQVQGSIACEAYLSPKLMPYRRNPIEEE